MRPLLTILLWLITSLVWSGAASDQKAGKVETSNFAAKAPRSGGSQTGGTGGRFAEVWPRRDWLPPRRHALRAPARSDRAGLACHPRIALAKVLETAQLTV
jgi:hypothetical protein